MAGKRKYKKRPYYGKKGGTAEYKDELKFDLYTTMKALKDYYKGKSREEKED